MDELYDLLSPEQLITRYQDGVTLKTLKNWRVQHKGPPFVKIGRQIYYREKDVRDWEAKRTVGRFRLVDP